MTAVTVVGAEGFVGSAFVRQLAGHRHLRLRRITRKNFALEAGQHSNIVIDCAGNSRKYLAERDPVADFEGSAARALRVLQSYPADLHVHISSVDVYCDLTSPSTTREDVALDVARVSHYGLHKLVAEHLVRHYAREWLVFRLAGMVGPGLRKNPVYDILNGQPLRINPDSRYQFMDTADVARIAWTLIERGLRADTVNLCGDGLVSPRQIAEWARRDLDLSAPESQAPPRIVNVCVEKLRGVVKIPPSKLAVRDFLARQQ